MSDIKYISKMTDIPLSELMNMTWNEYLETLAHVVSQFDPNDNTKPEKSKETPKPAPKKNIVEKDNSNSQLFVKDGGAFYFTLDIGKEVSKDDLEIAEEENLITIKASIKTTNLTKYGQSSVTKVIEHFILKPIQEDLKYSASFVDGFLTIKGTF